jgi:hypothetical protein
VIGFAVNCILVEDAISKLGAALVLVAVDMRATWSSNRHRKPSTPRPRVGLEFAGGRRLKGTAPLRRAGRQDRRPQTLADYTQGGLTNDSLSYTQKLHHIDGRDPSLREGLLEKAADRLGARGDIRLFATPIV